MPQEEQCPAITTEGGHLWASKDRSAQKDGFWINQKEQKKTAATNISLPWLHCQSTLPEADGNLRHQHRKLQPPPLQASCSGAALPGHRIRELVEGHIQMPQLISNGACTTRKSTMDFESRLASFWPRGRQAGQAASAPNYVHWS